MLLNGYCTQTITIKSVDHALSFRHHKINVVSTLKLNINSTFKLFYLTFNIRLTKKNKSYVSKLPRAFVFWCAFDSAKFKVWIFFAFMSLPVNIYKKRYDRHNETLWTTDFFNFKFCLVSCSSKNQVSYFKAVNDSNLTRLLLRKKKTVKKKRI